MKELFIACIKYVIKFLLSDNARNTKKRLYEAVNEPKWKLGQNSPISMHGILNGISGEDARMQDLKN